MTVAIDAAEVARRPLRPHGTPAAIRRHRRAGHPMCRPCLAAHAACMREYSATGRYRLPADWPGPR